MEIISSSNSIIFKFTPRKRLVINKKDETVEYWDGKIPFSQIRGYWKNYHPKGRNIVYYVMILTSKKIHKVTPELRDESAIDNILRKLEVFVPLEVKK